MSRGDVTWTRDGGGGEDRGDTSDGAESDHFFFYVKEHECWVRLEKIWNCSQGRSYMDRKAPRLEVEASFRNRKRLPSPNEKEKPITTTDETPPSPSVVGASTSSLFAKIASARSRFTRRGRTKEKGSPVM